MVTAMTDQSGERVWDGGDDTVEAPVRVLVVDDDEVIRQ